MSRNYKFKDIEMLVGSSVMYTNLKNNVGLVQAVNPNWTEEFCDTKLGEVQQAMVSVAGFNRNILLRHSTLELESIFNPLRKNISLLKVMVETYFPDTKHIVLNDMGYNAFFKKMQRKDQEVTIQFTYQLSDYLTETKIAEMSALGISATLLNEIKAAGPALSEKDIIQEHIKADRIEETQETIKKLNDIYEEVIGICKILLRYFDHDDRIREQFTFSHIIDRMRFQRKKEEEEAGSGDELSVEEN